MWQKLELCGLATSGATQTRPDLQSRVRAGELSVDYARAIAGNPTTSRSTRCSSAAPPRHTPPHPQQRRTGTRRPTNPPHLTPARAEDTRSVRVTANSIDAAARDLRAAFPPDQLAKLATLLAETDYAVIIWGPQSLPGRSGQAASPSVKLGDRSALHAVQRGPAYGEGSVVSGRGCCDRRCPRFRTPRRSLGTRVRMRRRRRRTRCPVVRWRLAVGQILVPRQPL